MKTILEKNCSKKVKLNKQRKMMTEIGINAFIAHTPKFKIGMHKTKSMNREK